MLKIFQNKSLFLPENFNFYIASLINKLNAHSYSGKNTITIQ